MARLSKNYYSLILLLLILVLTGCELRREEGDISDPNAQGELPTIAPLGSEEEAEVSAEATAIPTVITLDAIEVEPVEEEDVTTQPSEEMEPTDLAAEPSAEAEEASAVPATSATETETTNTDTEAMEPVIVNATAEEVPSSPIAANPPANNNSSTEDYYTDTGTTTTTTGGTYVVQSGDTLFSLSQRYNISVQSIRAANNLTSDVIYEGQELVIPAIEENDGYYYPPTTSDQGTAPSQTQETYPGYEGRTHVVTEGETLYSIAQQYNLTVEDVGNVNAIGFPYTIYIGQVLEIPTPANYGNAPVQQPNPNGSVQQPQQPQQPYPGAGTHTVAAGETLYGIAQQYGITTKAIVEANGLTDPNQITLGQTLIIPY